MRDKQIREMNYSSDCNDPDGYDHPMRQTRGGSAKVHESSLIDQPHDMNQRDADAKQEDVECLSPNDSPARKEKSFASQVIGLLPFVRGDSQENRVMNNDQKADHRSKLEEDFMTLQKTCETLKKDSRNAAAENKHLRSKLKNAEDQLETTRALGRQEVQRQQTEIKQFKVSNGTLTSDLKIAEDRIVRLQLEIHAADERFEAAEIAAAEEISRLSSDVATANQELFQEKRSALKEIGRLQSRIKDLTEKTDRFRDMLIPVSEKQILDAEVVQKFTSLRSSIMALLRRTWALRLRKDFDVGEFSRGQHLVFMSGDAGSYDKLRYVVFEHIYQMILDSKNYFLKDGFESLGEYLHKGEKSLLKKSPVENHTLVLEWRNASFRVTEAFRGDGERLSRATQSEIWEFLRPLETVDNAAEAFGKEKLKAICDAAIDLSLTIRQSKDNFWVDNMTETVGEPVSDWDKFTEEMAMVPAGDGKQPGTIAYVIAGALIKNPKEDLEKVLVLEKAEVAVYR